MLVIKLGGSLLMNSLTEINSKVFSLVEKVQKHNIPCVISIGGGKFCRLLQNDLKKNGITDEKSLDEIGISSVNLNAEYIKLLFNKNKLCFSKVINSNAILEEAVNSRDLYKFFISGAWEKRQSSDAVSVKMAMHFGSTTVVRMSDISSVYDSDPDVNVNAKKLDKISWDEYLKIINNVEFKSGGNYPVDPIAAKLAKNNRIKFIFTTLDEFLNANQINIDSFSGTVIS